MRLEIKRYLSLAERTHAFKTIEEGMLSDPLDRLMFGSGLGLHIPDPDDIDPSWLVAEWQRKSAVPFDIERSVTVGVYRRIRPFADELYSEAEKLTAGFTTFDKDKLFAFPHLLPIFQHLAGIFSKACLKKEVGSVSDTGFSKPAAERLANLLSERVVSTSVSKSNILQRMESTLEGIVRDLVGRVLLEEVVAESLKDEEVPFLREEDYPSLSGVVYNFRADFVVPNEKNPVAFIEVRKSSTRHASLYAKDKMFSAINWKGHFENLIGIIVVDGDWTQATLQTMSKVFDYVIPLQQCPFMAKVLKKASDGDETVLKWLISFSIKENPKFKEVPHNCMDRDVTYLD
ncbi:MAG TPA: hypothetical protein VMW67_02455 [Desulfobacteria bacterium]|nr:hypothetical protein [Desulfobacteria bacterium]